MPFRSQLYDRPFRCSSVNKIVNFLATVFLKIQFINTGNMLLRFEVHYTNIIYA